MEPLNVAVIGCGKMGSYHAEKYKAFPGVLLVGVCDTNQIAGKALAERIGANYFADYRELAANVDAVSIATITSSHREIATFFLDQGIHTLVEKPLTDSLSDAEAIVKAAREGDAILQLGHIERFNPAYTAALPYISNGHGKKIIAVRSNQYTGRSMDVSVVFDLMVHDIDIMLSLINEPIREIKSDKTKVSERAQAAIRFENGSEALLYSDRNSQATSRYSIVFQDSVAVLMSYTEKQTFVRRINGADLEKSVEELADEWGPRSFERAKRLPAPDVDALYLEIQDFINTVTSSSVPLVNDRDGLEGIRIATEIQNSILGAR
jgi:predicted dehydrogenase